MKREKQEIEVFTDKKPTIYDEEFQQKSIEKVVNCVEKVTEWTDETRKAAKVTRYYIIGMILLLVFLIGGALLAVLWQSGSIEEFLDNMFTAEDVNKRIVCNAQGSNITFREGYLRDAYYFTQLFENSTCILIDKKNG